MAVAYKPTRCKTCARLLATVSPTGLKSAVADTPGCSMCEDFSALYDAVQAADREWAEMEPKRDTAKAKQVARIQHVRLHMEFDNWLMGVEDVHNREQEQRDDASRGGGGEETYARGEDHHQRRNAKRARSHSPVLPEHQDVSPDNDASESATRAGHSISFSLRPSPKRSRSTTSLPERKRLKFSDSVEFRDEYRGSAEFLRSDVMYTRGRYALPDGEEYLDTSGSGKSFTTFTGLRRIRGDWVEIAEKEDEGEVEPGEATTQHRNPEAPEESPVQAEVSEMYGEENSQPDERTNRVARRRAIVLGGVSKQSQRKPQLNGIGGLPGSASGKIARQTPGNLTQESLGLPNSDTSGAGSRLSDISTSSQGTFAETKEAAHKQPEDTVEESAIGQAHDQHSRTSEGSQHIEAGPDPISNGDDGGIKNHEEHAGLSAEATQLASAEDVLSARPRQTDVEQGAHSQDTPVNGHDFASDPPVDMGFTASAAVKLGPGKATFTEYVVGSRDAGSLGGVTVMDATHGQLFGEHNTMDRSEDGPRFGTEELAMNKYDDVGSGRSLSGHGELSSVASTSKAAALQDAALSDVVHDTDLQRAPRVPQPSPHDTQHAI